MSVTLVFQFHPPSPFSALGNDGHSCRSRQFPFPSSPGFHKTSNPPDQPPDPCGISRAQDSAISGDHVSLAMETQGNMSLPSGTASPLSMDHTQSLRSDMLTSLTTGHHSLAPSTRLSVNSCHWLSCCLPSIPKHSIGKVQSWVHLPFPPPLPQTEEIPLTWLSILLCRASSPSVPPTWSSRPARPIPHHPPANAPTTRGYFAQWNRPPSPQPACHPAGSQQVCSPYDGHSLQELPACETPLISSGGLALTMSLIHRRQPDSGKLLSLEPYKLHQPGRSFGIPRP